MVRLLGDHEIKGHLLEYTQIGTSQGSGGVHQRNACYGRTVISEYFKLITSR